MALEKIFLANTFAEWVTIYNNLSANTDSIMGELGGTAYLKAVTSYAATGYFNVAAANTLTVATSATFTGANVIFGATSNTQFLQANNLHIYGGTDGHVLTTDGNGLLEWQAGSTVTDFTDLTGTISGSQIDGNVSIPANTTFTGSNAVFEVSNVNFGSVSSLHIDGGTSGQYLTTDGAGTMSWGTPDFTDLTGTISGSQIDGNVSIPANTTFTGSNAVFEVSNVNFGSVSSLHIDGGTSGQYLTTDGAGTMSWGTPGGNDALDHDEFTGDGSNTVFTVTSSPANTSGLQVWVGGAIQVPLTNYSVNGNNVTFTSAPSLGTQIYTLKLSSGTMTATVAADSVTTAKLAQGAVTLEKIATNARLWKSHRWTANGTGTTYDVTTSPANTDGLFVSVGGVSQDPETNYTVSGNTVTLSSAPDNGTKVLIRSVGFTSNVAVVASGSVTTVKLADDAVTFAKTDNTWNSISTNTTMVAGGRYFVDCSSANVAVTLPVSPTQGDWVRMIDATGSSGVNPITVTQDANSISIQGSNSSMTVSTNRAAFSLVYYNTTEGWLLTEV